jgi:hypothetical protein
MSNGYEENGDIVEGIYVVLEKFLRLNRENKDHPNVQLMDKHQELLSQAIKHASVYQSGHSFIFLKSLVHISEKFKDKNEMEAALDKIAPPSIRRAQAKTIS